MAVDKYAANGGNGAYKEANSGGAGGSGIVIIRYRAWQDPACYLRGRRRGVPKYNLLA